MAKLSPADLMPLEQYARERAAFRARLIEHRRARALRLGEHCSLSFEDRLTVQYQIQEMLRTERIFEPAGIAEELDAYNPLIPDGANLKATMMLEYAEPAERARELAQLRGIERHCWLSIEGFPPVYAIADEDLARENEQKTSAVHFLRFEFTSPAVDAAKAGAAMAAGIDHPHYRVSVEPLPAALRDVLAQDFD
jgi:hypothetical protein